MTGWSQQITAILPELLLTGYGFVLLVVTVTLRRDRAD